MCWVQVLGMQGEPCKGCVRAALGEQVVCSDWALRSTCAC